MVSKNCCIFVIGKETNRDMEKKIVKIRYRATNNIRTFVDAIKMCIDNPHGLSEDDSYIWDIE